MADRRRDRGRASFLYRRSAIDFTAFLEAFFLDRRIDFEMIKLNMDHITIRPYIT